MAEEQLAVSGKARYQGVVPASIALGNAGNQASGSASVYTLTIFTKIDKSPEADVALSRDNDNEVQAMHRTNKTMKLSFSAKPIGNARADALAIAANMPLKLDVCVITCAGDAQVAGTAFVDSASGSYTPDGEFVLDLVVIKYPATFAVAS